MVWPAIIAAGASLLGSYISSQGNKGGGNGGGNTDLGEILKYGREQYQPYINQGYESQGRANHQYNRMSGDPMSFLNEIINGYKPSEGYRFKEKKALEAARNSAAQGGFTGTPQDQAQQSELATGLADQDVQQWLQNVLGVQGAGLSGQQHVADTGYHASQSLSDLLGNAYGAKAGLAQRELEQSRANQSGMLGGLSGLIGGAAQGIGGMDFFKGMGGGGNSSAKQLGLGGGASGGGGFSRGGSTNFARATPGASRFNSVYGGGK